MEGSLLRFPGGGRREGARYANDGGDVGTSGDGNADSERDAPGAWRSSCRTRVYSRSETRSGWRWEWTTIWASRNDDDGDAEGAEGADASPTSPRSAAIAKRAPRRFRHPVRGGEEDGHQAQVRGLVGFHNAMQRAGALLPRR